MSSLKKIDSTTSQAYSIKSTVSSLKHKTKATLKKVIPKSQPKEVKSRGINYQTTATYMSMK